MVLNICKELLFLPGEMPFTGPTASPQAVQRDRVRLHRRPGATGSTLPGGNIRREILVKTTLWSDKKVPVKEETRLKVAAMLTQESNTALVQECNTAFSTSAQRQSRAPLQRFISPHLLLLAVLNPVRKFCLV